VVNGHALRHRDFVVAHLGSTGHASYPAHRGCDQTWTLVFSLAMPAVGELVRPPIAFHQRGDG
jgi:hypothetical protein